MDIRDLHYFLALSRCGTFTAAARSVHIVQSAMSASIARLEKDLGVTLIDRGTAPVVLTPHGTAFRDAAQRVVDAVQQARDDVAAVDRVVTGTVTLGATMATGNLDLGDVLTRLRHRHPHVIVHVRQSSAGTEGHLHAVLSGDLDIALTGGDGTAPTGVRLHPLMREPLQLLCPRTHRLARAGHATVGDLAGETLLRFPPGWGIRTLTDRIFSNSQPSFELADYRLITDLVRAGFGTSVVPGSAIADMRGLALIPLDDDRLVWTLHAATPTRRRSTAAAQALLAELTSSA